MENTKPQEKVEEQVPVADTTHTLLGAIKYINESDIDLFLNNLTKEQAIMVLLVNANYTINRGSILPLEAELLSKSIRTLTKTTEPDTADPIKATPDSN